MKPGSRGLSIAESYAGSTSTLAGVVMTPAGRVDGFGFGRCTVGGTDVTDAVVDLATSIGREDVRTVLIAGVALAWFNIVDLQTVAGRLELPVVSVTFEESEGLESVIRTEFDEPAATDRLQRYRSLPPRHDHELEDDTVYLRAAGCDLEEARRVVDAFTPSGATKPEGLRVAKLAARGLDRARTTNAI